MGRHLLTRPATITAGPFEIVERFHCSQCGEMVEKTTWYSSGQQWDPLIPEGWSLAPYEGTGGLQFICPAHKVKIVHKGGP